MVASKTLAVSAVVAALSAPALVDAHGYLMVPKAYIPTSGDPTKYASTIYGPNALTPPAGMKFSDTIDRNLAAFTQAYKKAGWSSLASFLKKHAPGAGSCGISKLDTKNPQTVGDYVQWSSFAESHVGPCEVWCGSTRVFQNDNCAGAYKSTPAKLPINKAKCANAKQLTFYWLALHEINWQVYINCVSLKGKESRSIDDDEEETSTDDVVAADADTEDRANEEDCNEEYPEPADNSAASATKDEDCDEEYPEPADNSAASAAKDEDCDEEYPEPADDSKPADDSTPADDEVAGDADTDASAAKDEDCDEEYPEPADNSAASAASAAKDEDCDEEYPEPADDSKPADEDCDEEYPEPSDNGDSDNSSNNNGGSSNNNSGNANNNKGDNNNAGGDDEYAGGDADEYAGGDADTAAGDADTAAGDADTAAGDANASKPADEDCDEEYPEPADNSKGSEDCDEEYPEPADKGSAAGDADASKPADEDCDEEYPEPADNSKGSEDCDEEYPEPSETPSVTPAAARSIDGGAEDVNGSNGYNFNSLKGQYSPGKAEAEQY